MNMYKGIYGWTNAFVIVAGKAFDFNGRKSIVSKVQLDRLWSETLEWTRHEISTIWYEITSNLFNIWWNINETSSNTIKKTQS